MGDSYFLSRFSGDKHLKTNNFINIVLLTLGMNL